MVNSLWSLNKEEPQNFDKLDFCLQSSNGSIIVTLLINQVPLYDCIVAKEAEFEHITNEAKQKFWLQMYNFDCMYDKELDEEELFYHNFPENLMPIDQKHPLVGMWLNFIFHALIINYKHLEEFYANGNEIPNEEFEDVYTDKENNFVACLCCNCLSTECYSISMEIKANDGKVEWFNFNTWGNLYNPNVKFIFEESQYLEVLMRLKALNDNVKNNEDFQEFKYKKWTENKDYPFTNTIE